MAIPLNQQRPRYREAHPRFDIVQARARAADRPVLVFEERGGTRGQLIIPAQIRAARGLLNWTQDKLAQAAKIALSSIRDIEAEKRSRST